MNIRRRIAVVRREVKRLAAIAAERAAQAQSPRAAPSFRPLTEAETESIFSDDLLASLTDVLTS
jgi:hypothetical protein